MASGEGQEGTRSQYLLHVHASNDISSFTEALHPTVLPPMAYMLETKSLACKSLGAFKGQTITYEKNVNSLEIKWHPTDAPPDTALYCVLFACVFSSVLWGSALDSWPLWCSCFPRRGLWSHLSALYENLGSCDESFHSISQVMKTFVRTTQIWDPRQQVTHSPSAYTIRLITRQNLPGI